MENKDILDILTPTYGDMIDGQPPYIGYGPSGRPLDKNRTEEAAGSNPARSTQLPPQMGVLYYISIY